MADEPQAAPQQPAAPAAAPQRPQSIEERISAALVPPDAEPEQRESAETGAVLEPERDEPERAEEADAEPERATEDDGEADTAGGEDDDAATVSTLAELADYIGVEVADLYNLKIPVSLDDGQRGEVSLSEWKDAYQAATKLRSETAKISEQRKAFEAERQQRTQQLEWRLTEAAAMAEQAERLYLADLEGINWAGLRENAPDEWAAKRQEVLERRQQLAVHKQQIMQRIEHQRAEHAQQMQAARAARLEQEARLLVDAVPEWRDEKRAAAEKADLAGYLRGVGFTEHDVQNASDHRLIAIARKAMLYDTQAKQTNAVKKKIVKLGKSVLKPGAKQSRADGEADRFKKLRTQMRKRGGKVEDAAALISALSSRR